MDVDLHRAALHQTMMTMQTVVMQVNEEVRALETQLQHLQLLAGSMLQPGFAFQRDLGSVMKRETRVLLHDEAFEMVAGLKSMRDTMMSEYKAETASYPTQTSEPAKALASRRSLAYSVVDGDGDRAGKRVWLDGSRRSESHRSDGLEAPRTGRTDPDRDEARARRRKEREWHRGFEDADDRLPPVVDDESRRTFDPTSPDSILLFFFFLVRHRNRYSTVLYCSSRTATVQYCTHTGIFVRSR